jgi:hypothetical protein
MTVLATDTAWYVYGVVPADAKLAALDLVSEGALAAIVARVDLAEFGEEPLRRNLEDRAWLERTVRAHDRVLAGAVGEIPLVPLRFGTVFRDEDGVREMLRERADELRDALERLRGRVELGVKVFILDEPQSAESQPATGREYLLQKQRARDAASTVQAEALEQVRALHENLVSLADDARANPPQSSELSGRGEPMLLNAAYLVTTEQQPEFTAAASDRGNARLEVVVTGPWPPYNFVEPVGPA